MGNDNDAVKLFLLRRDTAAVMNDQRSSNNLSGFHNMVFRITELRAHPSGLL